MFLSVVLITLVHVVIIAKPRGIPIFLINQKGTLKRADNGPASALKLNLSPLMLLMLIQCIREEMLLLLLLLLKIIIWDRTISRIIRTEIKKHLQCNRRFLALRNQRGIAVILK